MSSAVWIPYQIVQQISRESFQKMGHINLSCEVIYVVVLCVRIYIGWLYYIKALQMTRALL